MDTVYFINGGKIWKAPRFDRDHLDRVEITYATREEAEAALEQQRRRVVSPMSYQP